MTITRLFMGIDGGGSKTTALLAGDDETILGRGTSGASNYHSIGLVPALSALDAACTAALSDAGLPGNTHLASVAFGMSGVDRPEDRLHFQNWAASRFPGAQIKMVSDAHLVLAAGAGNEPGLAMISGTGSIVYAQDGAGRTARAGGWGYLLGDEGSGYKIGLAGLQSVARSWDGLEPPTELTRRLLGYLNLSSPTELVGFTYNPKTTRGDIGRLSILVEECAQSGDEIARRILDEAALMLARFAHAAARKLDLPDQVACAMAGGVLLHSAWLRESIVTQAQTLGLTLDPVTTVPDPAVGALRLAVLALHAPS